MADSTVFADLLRVAHGDPSRGALWGTESEDLDATLVAWPEGQGVARHTNDEVDVLMVVLEGTASVTVGEIVHSLATGGFLLIPKGSERLVKAVDGRLVYLNVHKRRKKMAPSSLDAFRKRTAPGS
jgi:quercetin dioxygenase-like cupin family protein